MILTKGSATRTRLAACSYGRVNGFRKQRARPRSKELGHLGLRRRYRRDMTEEADASGKVRKTVNLTASYLRLADTSGILAQRAALGDLSKLMKVPVLTPDFSFALEAMRHIDTSWINDLAPRIPLPSFDGFVVSEAVRNIHSAVAAAAGSWVVPQVDTSWVATALADLGKTIGTWRNPLADFMWPESLPVLPSNLGDIDVDLGRVSDLVHEGVTLYGVPGPLLARRLLAAPDKARRRAILGRELVRVARDCTDALDACVAPETRESVAFARNAIAAVEDGHVAAGQALASNALDTQLWRWFSRNDYIVYTSHKKTSSEDVDDWDVRTHMALGPVWAAHQQFAPGGTALIPGTYARHASTHAVSSRQYNRRNAAQALLLLTSLIVYANEEVAYPQAAVS